MRTLLLVSRVHVDLRRQASALCPMARTDESSLLTV